MARSIKITASDISNGETLVWFALEDESGVTINGHTFAQDTAEAKQRLCEAIDAALDFWSYGPLFTQLDDLSWATRKY